MRHCSTATYALLAAMIDETAARGTGTLFQTDYVKALREFDYATHVSIFVFVNQSLGQP